MSATTPESDLARIMADRSFEILEHPSDLGIRAWGTNLGEAFVNAARGLMSVILEDQGQANTSRRSVQLVATDREHLLVKWLSEILYLYDADGFVPSVFQITALTDTSLEAEISGETFDESKHRTKLDVKAITYHQLKIDKIKNREQITVYVDI